MCIVSKHLEKVMCLEKCAFCSSVVSYVSRVFKKLHEGSVISAKIIVKNKKIILL